MTIESEIKEIKQRNARVEADKAWETSFMRRGVITISTYLLSLAIFTVIEAPNSYVAALIPSLAYLLSTVTFPPLKTLWLVSRK